MATYTPVDLVVTTEHTEGHHTVGYVLDGAFIALSATPSGYVEAAKAAAGSADDHPLAVQSGESPKRAKPNG